MSTELVLTLQHDCSSLCGFPYCSCRQTGIRILTYEYLGADRRVHHPPCFTSTEMVCRVSGARCWRVEQG